MLIYIKYWFNQWWNTLLGHRCGKTENEDFETLSWMYKRYEERI